MEYPKFVAAPCGWRVVWITYNEDEKLVMVTAPMAGWITGIDDHGDLRVHAATHCDSVDGGKAHSSDEVTEAYDVAETSVAHLWKVLGPADPEPSDEECQRAFRNNPLTLT